MRKINRRDFLKAAGILAAASALTACGGADSPAAAARRRAAETAARPPPPTQQHENPPTPPAGNGKTKGPAFLKAGPFAVVLVNKREALSIFLPVRRTSGGDVLLKSRNRHF